MTEDANNTSSQYRVLARKYRPQNFDDLIGQSSMVQILSRAIETGRLAHAFMLTGVRGIGKTTTARILAKAFNCIGHEKDEPTISPCGTCENCVSITEDRHLDVMELDAASRTGVDDIRELIDGVNYKPVSARYKVYIIDEIHMLSKNAFNALLKTLEEPPAHVKFIFATTEIHKIPVTILSRCQRFDLRRVDEGELSEHFKRICGKEDFKITDQAASLVAKAAAGSVRDGLSLLDQAMATSEGEVSEDIVSSMLGLSHRDVLFDLFDYIHAADADKALEVLHDLYFKGANPSLILEELLEITNWLTRMKVNPKLSDEFTAPEGERKRGKVLSESLSIPVLSRTWQVLLKGVGEVKQASNDLQALEMLIIRLCYTSTLPTPMQVLEGGVSVPPTATKQPSESSAAAQKKTLILNDFEDIVGLCEEAQEMVLASRLRNQVNFVSSDGLEVKLRISDKKDHDILRKLQEVLRRETEESWAVSSSEAEGEVTIAEKIKQAEEEDKKKIEAHPFMQNLLTCFPDAEIENIIENTVH